MAGNKLSITSEIAPVAFAHMELAPDSIRAPPTRVRAWPVGSYKAYPYRVGGGAMEY